ncbi:splicing factor 3B subunit 1-like [Dorcoceras hygrometricum]|uniref:Splicing factor 3B subunit 1-like n=1 Tax=Dorcoceras hygrometricum TaxID=472368 RepID=A0A2Z7D5J2_9LAMI|nr:splicing factor 3B subunit 1-like [Dorcoceras hygrometricum]
MMMWMRLLRPGVRTSDAPLRLLPQNLSFGILISFTLSLMASALINNTVQVLFASVLALFENSLVEFYHNASVRDGMVVSTVQGKPVVISEELFASTFELPLQGLTDLHEVPQDLFLEARRAFSHDGKLKRTSCKKREMVVEFRLLNDILAKSVTVKAGSFDVVTHERFLMMSALYGGVLVNWRRLLFNIFKDMVTPTTRQAKGYAVQICVLLKNAPDFELGESKEFPPLKILTTKTVGTYLAKNKNIYVDEDEQVVEKPAEKKKAVSKKRPAPTIDTPVVKRKRPTGRGTLADKSLALLTIAQEAVPIQMISADTPPAPKRKATKRRLKLPAGSDDEIVEKEPDVVDVVEQQREQTTVDAVDKIIDIRSSTINNEYDNIDGAENEIARKMASFTASKQFPKEPLRSREDDDMFGFKTPSKIIETEKYEGRESEPKTESEDTGPLSKELVITDSTQSDEESMSIEDILKHIPADLMLPSMMLVRMKLGSKRN